MVRIGAEYSRHEGVTKAEFGLNKGIRRASYSHNVMRRASRRP